MAGIYLHIPFCKQACYYCDFHFSTQISKKEQMLIALERELELRKEEFRETTVETIYFGGGTPSLLTIEEIERLLTTVAVHYNVSTAPEITLEANPDDLDKNYIIALSKSSINRLSIGVQSFFDEDLKLMNRAHNAGEALRCLRDARAYFDNVSVDLIYGIPGLSDERWMTNIEKALEFDIPHISSYALTVEPKTALENFIKRGIIAHVDDEQSQKQFYILVNILEKAGFVNYEISNFGRPGFFSKNNTAYWLGKEYLGIGPSAHSFNGTHRSWNVRNNPKYIKALELNELPIEKELLTVTDRYNEYVMTGLRTIWGVSLEEIEKRFGKKYQEFLMLQAQKHIDRHHLHLNENVLRATKKGKFLIDGIASDLFMLNLV